MAREVIASLSHHTTVNWDASSQDQSSYDHCYCDQVKTQIAGVTVIADINGFSFKHIRNLGIDQIR